MRLYPDLPTARTRQVVSDLVVVALIILFAWLGMKVNNTVDDLAVLGRGVKDAGGAVQGSLSDAGNAVAGIPLVGGDLKSALTDAGSATGGNVQSAGSAGEQAVERTAQVLGWITFGIPTLLVLLGYLPWRIRRWRRLNAAAAVLAAGADEERRRLLAMRAALALPYGDLLPYTRDPIGDLAEGRYEPLLQALYA
ncbi:MAG: hypothetical protein ACKOTH_01850, partial [Solirubrobacterales bacterium]